MSALASPARRVAELPRGDAGVEVKHHVIRLLSLLSLLLLLPFNAHLSHVLNLLCPFKIRLD